jgi:hypothetical protein
MNLIATTILQEIVDLVDGLSLFKTAEEIKTS